MHHNLKIEMFEYYCMYDLQESVNTFIADKAVFDIKYINANNGYHIAMVIYKGD